MPLSHCPPWASVSPTVRWSDVLRDLRAPGDGGRQQEAGSRVCAPHPTPRRGGWWAARGHLHIEAHLGAPLCLTLGRPGGTSQPLDHRRWSQNLLTHSFILCVSGLFPLCTSPGPGVVDTEMARSAQPLPLRALHSTGWRRGGRNRSWERSGGETVTSSCEASLGTPDSAVSSAPS